MRPQAICSHVMRLSLLHTTPPEKPTIFRRLAAWTTSAASWSRTAQLTPHLEFLLLSDRLRREIRGCSLTGCGSGKAGGVRWDLIPFSSGAHAVSRFLQPPANSPHATPLL
ncbi:hypothetical protein IG631_04587 [Alternaria alternata]|nr:hypothetical protein IG631_04587 [Alternaria alternata]